MDPDLLKILCCPETHQGLRPAGPELIDKLNRQITSGGLHNRAGQNVTETIESGLVRADGQYLYPVHHGIPVMLVGESIRIG